MDFKADALSIALAGPSEKLNLHTYDNTLLTLAFQVIVLVS